MAEQGPRGITWTDQTWNPIRGCSRVSPGCQHCYAEAVAARFSGPGQAYEGLARRRSNGEPQWTGEVRVIESHMLDPIRWRKPRRIFVNSMSDLFHEKVSDETIDRVFAVMALAQRHTFQILTKRPQRMRDYLADEETLGRVHRAIADLQVYELPRKRYLEGVAGRWPMRHVWLGVSVENQATANERIPLLLETPAAIRFLSCEPLLGPVQIPEYLPNALWNDLPSWKSPEIDWVIIGGESGRNARPCDVQWIREIVGQCRAAGVAPFVKQLGAKPCDGFYGRSDTGMQPLERRIVLRDSHGGDMDEWPDDLKVREFPQTTAP